MGTLAGNCMASFGNFGAGVNYCYPPDGGFLAANGKKVLDDCLFWVNVYIKREPLLDVMQRLTAYVSGKVQKAGYRARVVTVAQNLRLKGYVQNLDDGRVKVVAEGDSIDLDILVRALDIKNTLINVADINKDYSSATGEFESFFKVVSGAGETDQRLDVAAEKLTELIVVNKEILMELKANRQELKETREDIRGSSDAIVGEIRASRDAIVGEIRTSQDAIVSEIKVSNDSIAVEIRESREVIADEIGELRADLKESVKDRLTRIESDISQIKARVGL